MAELRIYPERVEQERRMYEMYKSKAMEVIVLCSSDDSGSDGGGDGAGQGGGDVAGAHELDWES